MAVAGTIAETHPAQQQEGDREDEFTRWLRQHRIVRADGYWVGETRVAPPVPLIEESGSDELWRWSVRGGDSSPHLHLSNTTFVCWADHENVDYKRSESVRVQTVLVPVELASAYTRALQLDRDLWDFRIPTVDSAHEDENPVEGGDSQSQTAPSRCGRGFASSTVARGSTSTTTRSAISGIRLHSWTSSSSVRSRTTPRPASLGEMATTARSHGQRHGTIMDTKIEDDRGLDSWRRMVTWTCCWQRAGSH